ncbi:MAG: DUF1801 domain-containing protein [Cellulomonas sp.]
MASANEDSSRTRQGGDVEAFVASITDQARQQDARTLIELIARVTGEPPVLWGTSVVGFGRHTYRYPSGLQEDSAAVAFSPTKTGTTLYLIDGADGYRAMLVPLGPHKISKGSLHLKRLVDVDLDVLAELVRLSHAAVGRLA